MVYLPSTGSTNDDAKRLADAGEPEGLVVLADEQTAGRGRAGKRPWLTPERTAVALSVLLRPRLPAEQLPLLSLAAGVAAAEAVSSVADVACRLKWPNDVMVGSRKLGGVLVESAISGGSVQYAVAGIGLNVNVPAADLARWREITLPPTSLLMETGASVSRERLTIALIECLDQSYGWLGSGAPEARGTLLARYRAALATIGQLVRISGAGLEGVGVAEDVTETGALVLRLADGSRRTFTHGEVTVRPV